MSRIRFLALLIALAFVVGTVGCGGAESADVESIPVPSPSTSPTAAPTPTPSPSPTPTPSPEPIPPDIRNVNWGMSAEEVKARETEGALATEKATALFYRGISLAGLDSMVVYIFNKHGELYGMNYVITEQHSRDAAYITDYESLKALLVEKYGPPSEDKELWLDDLWKGDDPGMALITGDLMYWCKWETDPMIVFLTLAGDNYEIDFKLMYQSNLISSDTGKTGTEGL